MSVRQLHTKESNAQRSRRNMTTSFASPANILSLARSAPHPSTESGFGQDLLKVHADAQAVSSTRAANTLVYVEGEDAVFEKERYVPDNAPGVRLPGYDLPCMMQQDAAASRDHRSFLKINSRGDKGPEMMPDSDFVANGRSPVVSRRTGPGRIQRQIGLQSEATLDDPRMYPPGAPKAAKCSPPAWCPKTFCQPYSSESYAIHMRTKMMPVLMAGIAIAVDSRVVPLWHEHLLGGSSVKNLSMEFGKDFTNSKTTERTTGFLLRELSRSIQSSPPVIPRGIEFASVDLGSRIGAAIAEIGNPASPNEMNFNYPKEVPGNIAGGIGQDQATCKVGAKPSPFNDAREAKGIANVKRSAGGDLIVMPFITYTVKDTIDLCPGDCGTSSEQVATIPISQFEATGISGDVPFIVEFPADARGLVIPAQSLGQPNPSTGLSSEKVKGSTP